MTMGDYLAVVSRKTARFLAACAEGGAALAGAPPRLRSAYRSFGESLGIAFQMADDIVDATGDRDVAGKPVRKDARNGVVTLPMIHACRLAGDHPAIAKLAAGESLARADEDAIYELLADEAVRRASLVTLEHHVRQPESSCASWHRTATASGWRTCWSASAEARAEHNPGSRSVAIVMEPTAVQGQATVVRAKAEGALSRRLALTCAIDRVGPAVGLNRTLSPPWAQARRGQRRSDR